MGPDLWGVPMYPTFVFRVNASTFCPVFFLLIVPLSIVVKVVLIRSRTILYTPHTWITTNNLTYVVCV